MIASWRRVGKAWENRVPQVFTAKRILFALLGMFFTGLLCLGVLEIGLRLALATRAPAEADVPLIRSTVPGLNYELKSGVTQGRVQTGAFGLRRRAGELTPGAPSILLIGDSISYGMGIDYAKSLAPELEQRLASLSPPPAVWNAAVPGYNTRQEALRLKQVGEKVCPQLVLLQYCLNDYLGAATLADDGILDAAVAESGPSRFSLGSLPERSKALQFAKGKVRDLQQVVPGLFPVWSHYVHRIPSKPGWQDSLDALVEIRDESSRLGARFLLVLFPYEQQVRIGERKAQDELVSFARRHGIEVHDLYDEFSAHWQEGLYVGYWKAAGVVDKVHLNERGHRLAAASIANAILKRSLTSQVRRVEEERH